MGWNDGDVIGFDNDDVVVHVRVHPRLHCVDVYYWSVGRKNHKFLGRYQDSISEWSLRRMIVSDHPELGLVYEETENAECGIFEDGE